MMKTNIKKTGLWLLLTVFCLNGYGQTEKENRFLITFVFENAVNMDMRCYVRTKQGREYYSLQGTTTPIHYYADDAPLSNLQGYYYFFELFEEPEFVQIYTEGNINCYSGYYYYHQEGMEYEGHLGGREGCDLEFTAIIEAPIGIIAGYNNGADRTCDSKNIRIDYEYYENDENYELLLGNLECRNEESDNWITIGYPTKYSTNLSNLSNSFLISAGIDPFKNMYFRTKCLQADGNYSIVTDAAAGLYPQFEFPADTDVEIEPSACSGGNTIIKIPYSGTTDYTVTVKGTNDYSFGSNPSLLSCSTEITDGVKYYLLPVNLAAGNYRLVIENKAVVGTPCPFETPFTVLETPSFTISALSYPNAAGNYEITKNGGTGSVQFNVSNSYNPDITIKAGTLSFTKTISSPVVSNGYYSGTATIDLPAGEYTVYATNASGCTSNNMNATLRQPAPITFTPLPSPPQCHNGKGSVELSNIGGGIGERKYRLDGGSPQTFNTATVTIPDIPSDNHTITIEDNYGNSLTQSFTIASAPQPVTITTNITSPTTSGGNDGTVTVSASGGTPTYQYSKDGTSYSSSNLLTGFTSGQKTIYVKDANGCVFSFQITIPEGRNITLESTTPIAPTCNGGADGSCILVVGNVEGILSVSNLPSDCTYDISGNIITVEKLGIGTHSCKITEDYNGKTNIIEPTFIIPQKPAIGIGTDVTPVSDKGTATGKIAVSVSGGNIGTYKVILLDEQNKPAQEKETSNNCTFENVFAGNYKIEVIDNKYCSNEATVEVKEPTISLKLTATLIDSISCYNKSDATISVSAEGGWGGYLYSEDGLNWNTTTTFNNLPANNYRYYVKDKYGGTADTLISIPNPAPLEIIIDSIADADCFSSATGSIRFLISGGTAPYSLTPAIGTHHAMVKNGNTYIIVSSLPAANYTFTLKDKNGCTLQAKQATVSQPAQLTVSTSGLTQPTCGWANGSLTAMASGGVVPYTYKLMLIGATNVEVQSKSSSEAVAFENIAGGNYYIAVIDDHDCVAQSAPAVFNQYTSPAINSVIVSDVVCFGESNGKITVIAQKGTADIDYFTLTKTSGNTTIQNATGVFENLTAGKYTLYVFDANDCQSPNAYPVTVKQPDLFSIEVNTIVPAVRKGANDGKIQFRVAGGNTGSIVVYLKDTENAKADSISVVRGFTNELSVKAGTYTLEATDCKDCRFTTERLQVEEPADSLRLIIKEVQDALCKSQTGRIAVEGQGGWGGYSYKRAADSQYTTLNRFENLYPGTYLITVKDRMGATATGTVTVYEPQDSLKAEIVQVQAPTCAANGALSVKLSGGTPPYKLFSDAGKDTVFVLQPETTQWANIASGSLLLHLTDANGCKFELETMVSDTALLRITGFEVIPPDAEQAANGSIRARVSGGTNPLTYGWRKIGHVASFPNNPLISNLSSGYFEVNITDGSGCSVTESVYLPDPGDRTITVVETGDETTPGAANGYAVLYSEWDFTNIRLINPENNYTDYPATTGDADFHISNSSIYLNNLESGKWFVIGTNTAGQNAIAGFEIKPCEAFVFGKIEVIPVSTPGGNDGSISVEIQGGGGENVFVWTDRQGNILPSDNEESGSRLSDLPAGKYTLTVTDKYGNTISTEIEILAPEQALHLTTLEQKNQSCNTAVDAYVILSAAGGWGDYRYAHYRKPVNNRLEYNNSEVYSELETGEHYFYVVDKYGTTAQLNMTVIEPDVLRASIANIENVKCKDDVNGQITFDISGGNSPYYFKESKSGIWQKGNTTGYLPAGKYTFEFTDSLQCISPDILTITITEPDSLLFQSIEVTHTTCGEDNGQMEVSLKGGTRPYTYQWRDPENSLIGTDSIVSGLKQNVLYRLYVTDKNGCTQYLEQLIKPSKPPRITAVETTAVLCYGDATGTARIAAIETGVPYAPYTFTWSNGTTGDATGNLPAGRHSVTITDENNCAATYYFDITQPDSLYLLITDYKEPHCFGYSDAYIRTQTFGGAGGYTYLWSNGATTPDNDNIPKGDYWVRVTDKNGCMFEKQFTLNEPAYQHIDLGKDIMMCPGNTHVIDGGNYVSYRWFTGKGDISNERYLSVRGEDRYYLEAKTPDGCSAWGEINISIGNNALQANMLLASVAAVGDTLVIFELSNLPLDSLKWEYDPEVFEKIAIEDEYYNLPYVLQLRCLQTGVYNIGLAAYSGGCYAPVVKQVEIVEAGDDDDDRWGAKESLIQSLKQYPNPTDGIFTVELELREPAEAKFVIFEVASGICLDQRIETGSDYYNMSYNLTHLQSGIYVLIVTSGNERRQLKIVIE